MLLYGSIAIPKRKVIPLATPDRIGGTPGNEDEQVAAGMDDVLDQSVLEALQNVRPEDLIGPDHQAEALKGNANPSGCWIYGPAMIEGNAQADKRFSKDAELDGNPTTKVEKAVLKLIPGTKLLVIKHAKANDLTATDVNRYTGASGFWINAFNLLGPAGLTVESGYRVRYDVAYIPKSSPLWPGLIINLGKPKERRQVGKKKDASK
jgi:hypothetical protein